MQRRCTSTQTSGDSLKDMFGFMLCRSIEIRLSIACCRVHIVDFNIIRIDTGKDISYAFLRNLYSILLIVAFVSL